MTVIEQNTLTDTQKIRVLKLWNQEYPAQLCYEDISGLDDYLMALKEPHHLLAMGDDGLLVAWAFSFLRDGERWFAIIIDGTRQRQGLGTSLLHKLMEQEPMLIGWVTDHDKYLKQNGDRYLSPLSFYIRNGFTVLNEDRLETEKLSAVKIKWTRPS